MPWTCALQAILAPLARRPPSSQNCATAKHWGESRMAGKKEGVDFLTRLRIRELILMGLMAISAVLANLPPEYVEETLGISRGGVLGVLGIMIMIGLLLRNGADPGMVTKEGDTPVELALRMGHAEVADLLKQARRTQEAPAAAGQPVAQASG